MVKITFLGTGSMVPTKDRNSMAILINYKEENILFDCGEGTQRQFRVAGITPTKLTRIIISHWHGDHTFGIPGMLLTLAASKYNRTLSVYGPKGTINHIDKIIKAYIPQIKMEKEVIEVEGGRFYENKDFYLEALRLDHTTDCLGYAFIEKEKRNIDISYLKKFGLKQHPILKELKDGKDIVWKGKTIKARLATKIKKGKKIAFITDTKYCDNAVKLAKNSDLLIIEATHLDELRSRSEEYKHLTSKQAALIAKKAKVKKLVLTHFSQRYKDTKKVKREAESIFKKKVLCAKDFMEISI